MTTASEYLQRLRALEERERFELAFRRYQDRGGHSYDAWDIAFAYNEYKENPEEYQHLFTEGDEL